MKQFPPNTKFKFPWRSYQARVLHDLDKHLEDDHLHVIAPPGSGKTILGLEVALRLNKPTIIFAPTLSIRNQWIQRFCELFLQTTQTPKWISTDVHNPEFLTVLTYQGLHAAFSKTPIEHNEVEDEDFELAEEEAECLPSAINPIIAKFIAKQVGTIVVDEAHHLKNAWWKSLDELKQALDVTVVGLTATPPYDVSFLEWNRYLDLNGQVDAEIAVPELVKAGDLCPHQDFVLFSTPTEGEGEKLREVDARAKRIFQEIKEDEYLQSLFEAAPYFKNPELQQDWIYNNIEAYSATLIYLHAAAIPIEKNHLEIIGDKNTRIPHLDENWLEVLLQFYLEEENTLFPLDLEFKEGLKNKLKRYGCWHRNKVRFRESQKRRKLLSNSLGKLKSIHRIVAFEQASLGEELRMVVLSDYIRKELLVKTSSNAVPITKMGVMSIFEHLRRTQSKQEHLGVLTGSIIIIPAHAEKALRVKCENLAITNTPIKPLEYDSRYCQVSIHETLRPYLVAMITELFSEGHIRILIGTKSLLGEGWDAPSINTLVLASFVGSFVLSNQMRGRAIRTQQGNPDKTGNIWHLVCLDEFERNGGSDLKLLKRRFLTFVGIDHSNDTVISNGIKRLALPDIPELTATLNHVNETMLNAAKHRTEYSAAWQTALRNGSLLVEEVKLPYQRNQSYSEQTTFYHNRTIAYLTGVLISGMLVFGESILSFFINNASHIKSMYDLLLFLSTAGVLFLVFFTWKALKTITLLIKHGDIADEIGKIGETIVASLVKEKIIITPPDQLKVAFSLEPQGDVYCHLEGGTTFEKSLFIKCLSEVVGLVDSPRYLIVRQSTILGFFLRKDYHSVPDVLDGKKRSAEYFAAIWRHRVGHNELVYTRNVAGRKTLLRARIHSLAAGLESNVERVHLWR